MTSIQILAQGAAAWGKTEGIVTAGAVGIPVTLQCSRDWDGLRKIIKFRCGEVEYQFEVVEGTAITVPWDCLLEGRRLEIALDGWDSAGTLRIPTNWVCCAMVQPSGTQGTEPPAPPQLLTQQLLEWAESTQEQLDRLPDISETEKKLEDLRQNVASQAAGLQEKVQLASQAAREAATIAVAKAGGWDYADLPVTDAPKTAAFADGGEAPMSGFPQYALLGQNLFPLEVGFNRSFPYNGITLRENGRVMHIDGAASARATVAVNKDSSPRLPLSGALQPGNTVILRTFLKGTTVKNGIYVTLLFYDGAGKQILFKNLFCGENGSDVSARVTVPANADSFGIWWNVQSPGGETHNADVCAVLYDAAAAIQAGTEDVPRDAAAVSFFPVPVSGFSYRVSIKDYIDRYGGGENALTFDALGYLTPEMFGAKGDYSTDDTAALNACLQAAAKRNLPVRGFKRYKTSESVSIAGRNLDVDINTIRYKGTDTAVTVEGWWNRVRIGRIYSDGIGLTIQSANDSTVYNQITLNDVISKEAHGIVVANGGNPIFQNQIQFARILGSKKAGTHGITYVGDGGSCAECTFTGGQISGYDYAVKLHSGNHKFYNIHVESNMEGGFWIIGGGCLISGDRHAESSRDGKYCFLKMTTDNTMHAVDVNGQYTSACRMPVNEIDLSEVCLTEGSEPIDNGHYFTLNCPISPGIYYQSNEHKTHYLSDGAKLWGGNIILNPTFQVYRKVTEAVFDNRTNDQKLEPLPTTFEIGTENCRIYLHASYCFMGYATFEVIQTESYQADFYDWRGTKIFSGADHGAGRFRLQHLITAEDGKGRYDGTGTQWVITKE